MSNLYLYDPDVCDGDICPGDCEYCSKRFDAELAHERWGKDEDEDE